MPDAFTPALGLTLPEIGASRDSWGAKLNGNTSVLDEMVAMSMPIGAILDFAGPQAPNGWLICDGRLVSRTTFSKLFGVIGTAWGAGDGTSNFALPPTPGRVSVGPGAITDELGIAATYTFASRFGAQLRQIAQANLPNYPMYTNVTGTHNHTGPVTAAGGHAHTTDAWGSHNHGYYTTDESANHTHTGYTDAQGQHTHHVNAWATSGGGQLAFAGGVATNGGVETDAAGNHSHNVVTYGASNSHQHGITTDGSHAHNVYAVGDHTHYIQWEGDHQHSVYLGGSGTWFDLRQPLMVVTKIIYAGDQASVRAMTAAALEAAPLELEGYDELAQIRAELAELRQIFGRPQRRLLRAPSRGPH